MTLHTRIRPIRIAAGSLALVVITGLVAGCVGGPKFSRVSPADWPGVKQVRGAGTAVGGWMAEKAKRKDAEREAMAARLKQREADRYRRQQSTNEKLKSIFAAANSPDETQPTDPFLAQLPKTHQSADSASQGASAKESRKNDLQPVAHSSDGPEISTPEPPAETGPVENPFADLASKATEPTTDNRRSKSFADGIDEQLARLRKQADVAKPSTSPAGRMPSDNPLRDAIFGITESKTADRIASLPESDNPAATVDDEPIEDNPFAIAKPETNVEEEVVPAAEIADEALPEWARASAPQSRDSDTPQKQETLPVTESEIESANESPFAETVDEPVDESIAEQEPSAEPVSPTEAAPVTEPADVAIQEETVPPAAIEIVPFDRRAGLQQRVDVVPSAVDVATRDDDASSRVELLPAPGDSGIATNATATAQLQPDQDGTNGMIVESDALPLGFVEWDDDETIAAGDAKDDFNSGTTTPDTINETPTRFAVNTNRSIPTSTASSKAAFESSFANDNNRPRLLQEFPQSHVVEETPADTATPSSLDPHLFDTNVARGGEGASSLDSIDWGAEADIDRKTSSSPVASTATIGLLIALACLIGLGLIRRLRAA